MPTASDELRDLMTKWFGDIDERWPRLFLLSHGFTERKGMIYFPTPSHTISKDEWSCLRFLIEEWDYGYNNVRLPL